MTHIDHYRGKGHGRDETLEALAQAIACMKGKDALCAHVLDDVYAQTLENLKEKNDNEF